METNLVMCDLDMIYSSRLMDRFRNIHQYKFNISIFTEISKLINYLNENNNIDILLIDEKIILNNIQMEGEIEELSRIWGKVNQVFVIMESKNKKFNLSIDDKGLIESFDRIFKYQESESFIEEIILKYREKEGLIYEGDKLNDTNVITVFSQTANITKLAFAKTVANILAESEKTLFIELEVFPVSLLATADIENHGISEVIYNLKENSKVTSSINKNLKNFGKLNYLQGVTHKLDILSITKDEIYKMVNEIKNEMDYLHLVFYISFYIDITEELISISNEVCIPYLSNTYERKLIEEWDRQEGLIQVKKENIAKIEISEITYNEAMGIVSNKEDHKGLISYARKYCERFI